MEFELQPLGDQAVLIDVGGEISETTLQKVQTITTFLDDQRFGWMVEYVPAFTTVTIYYDPIKVMRLQQTLLPFDYVREQLRKLLELKIQSQLQSRVVSIPVCYERELGPDLQFVAAFNGLSSEEVIQIHSSGSYLVSMIGFSPGFPYIGGMSERIATPRRSSPRLHIPAGSVGIAGIQTGIYPIETPGGWQIIGQTPLKLFLPNEETPSLLKAGDKIKFTPISLSEFAAWRDKQP